MFDNCRNSIHNNVTINGILSKQSIKSSLNAVLARKVNEKKQNWMIDHILILMENRKQSKNSDKDEYNRLNKQINSVCKETKEN